MARQQLPPQIKKIEIANRSTGKTELRYQVTVDAGADPATGKRRQTRKRFRTEKQARDFLTDTLGAVTAGTYVARRPTTIKEVVDQYLGGRHNLRASSRAKLEYDLAPLVEQYGGLSVQALLKVHVDTLVTDLCDGGTVTAKGRTRKPWSPSAVNKAIQAVTQVLEDARRQQFVRLNVAADVERVEVGQREYDTYSPDEIVQLMATIKRERNRHACVLALYGLRRGEIAGLMWRHVDFEAKTITVGDNTRVLAGGVKVVEGTGKTKSSRRVLPLTDPLAAELKAARKRQAVERLALGTAYGDGEYVVSNEAGYPYHPVTVYAMWADAVKAAGLRHIRLHDGRHTAATIMHLQGVPIATIAEWIGHSNAAFTQRTYAHSQPEAMARAAQSMAELMTFGDSGTG